MDQNDNRDDYTLSGRVASSKIYARGIEKKYESKHKVTLALSGIDIEILTNEFVSIVGPSGCGKSTLLRILGGLIEKTGGKIVLNDREMEGPGADRGMVFQGYTLFPWLTVEKNIEFGLKIKKMPVAERKKIVDKYLEEVGLTNFRRSYPKELSGGMKQRVAIARALANSPEVLLMDEPFGALDQQTKSSMQLLMRQIWQIERATVIFVTHDIEEAVFLSQRIYVMESNPGRIKAEIPIYLPYERTLDLKDDPEFIKIRKEISSLIQHE
ncbi:ABC transporter ATP-binding protein [Treponema primitia]|uniref:ABC transporter ATP-binding protein n=1 Tax=Treponema primitia TaxID=88058 RepID=UPI0002554CCE|nr:ABC transporter ATP-binding protein [Treponema primitia]